MMRELRAALLAFAALVATAMLSLPLNTHAQQLVGRPGTVPVWVQSSGGGAVSFPLVSTTIGSAGTPAFTFTGATNYGLYQAGTCIDLAAAGAEQIAACSSGTTFIQGGSGTIGAKSWESSASTFAGLGTPVNGTFKYCSDCTIANPCAAAGTGALAKRLNGAWVCN